MILVTIKSNFYHETCQGRISPTASYRRVLTMSSKKFELLPEMDEPGGPYQIDTRIIDGRLPFARIVSRAPRFQRWRAGELTGHRSGAALLILAPKVGPVRVEHGRREVELKPGQYTFLVSSEPIVSYFSANAARIVAVILDSDIMSDHRVTKNIGKEISLDAAGQLLMRHLDISLQLAPFMDSSAVTATSYAAGEMLSSLVFPDSFSRSPCSDTLRDQIKTYIEFELRNPRLDADQIAATHHVSVRTLQRLFSKSGLTVAAYIRARRMEKCKMEVEQRPDFSLTSICQRWGISDVKHFARQYRKHFGETPMEARRRLYG